MINLVGSPVRQAFSTVSGLTAFNISSLSRISGNRLFMAAIIPNTLAVSSIFHSGRSWSRISFFQVSTTHRVEVWQTGLLGLSTTTTLNVTLTAIPSAGGAWFFECSGTASAYLATTLATAVTGADINGVCPVLPDTEEILWLAVLGSNVTQSWTLDPIFHKLAPIADKSNFGTAPAWPFQVFTVNDRLRAKPEFRAITTNPAANNGLILVGIKPSGTINRNPVRYHHQSFNFLNTGDEKILTLTATPGTGRMLLLAATVGDFNEVGSITQAGVTWARLDFQAQGTAPNRVRGEVWVGSVGDDAGTEIDVIMNDSGSACFIVAEYGNINANDATGIEVYLKNAGQAEDGSFGFLNVAGTDQALVGFVSANYETDEYTLRQFDNDFGVVNIAQSLLVDGAPTGNNLRMALVDRGVHSAGSFTSNFSIADNAYNYVSFLLAVTRAPNPVPTLSNQTPAPSTTNVDRRSDIALRVNSEDTVTALYVDVRIGGAGSVWVPAIVNFALQAPFNRSGAYCTGTNPTNILLKYTGIYPANALVEIKVNATSGLGAVMPETIYSFTTANTGLAGVQVLQQAGYP